MTDPTDPRQLSWLLAFARALLPVRWGLCLLGLAVTLVLFSLGLQVFEGVPFRLQVWWDQPLGQLQLRQLETLFGAARGKAFFRSVLLVLPLSVLWSLIGGWIAFRECQNQRQADRPGLRSGIAFLQQKASSLVSLLPFVIFFVLLLSLVNLTAAVLNWVPGGAVLAAVALPLLLTSSLMILVAGVGCASFCIMPSAIAAEGTDSWDAISRGYSYLFQQPFAFLLWWGLSLVVAALPLAAAIGLVESDQDPIADSVKPVVLAAGLVLALSLFWSLQPLVYVKLRRLVDGTPESELWAGPALAPEAPKTPAAPQLSATSAASEGEPTEAPSAPVTPIPLRTTFRFSDTLTLGPAADLQHLTALLLALIWPALVLTLGGYLLWRFGARPGQELSLGALRGVVRTLAGQQPLLLAGVVVGMILATAPGLARLVKGVGRKVAVRVVYGNRVSLAATRSFIDQTRGQGWAGNLLLSAGVLAFLVVLPLVTLAVWEGTPWQEPALLGGTALLLLDLGALGIGSVVVEGRRLADKAAGPLGTYLGNGQETLASLLLSFVVGAWQGAQLAGFTWVAWLLTCDSLGWVSRAAWVRWGLDGRLVPLTDNPLTWFASRLAGLWFFLLAGLVLTYPLSYILRWGVVCYLRARQQTEEVPGVPLQLSDEERNDLLNRKKERKKVTLRK